MTASQQSRPTDSTERYLTGPYLLFMLLLTTAAAVSAYYPITGFFLELEDYMIFHASATKEEGVLALWTPAWSNYFRPMEWLFHDIAYAVIGLDRQAHYALAIGHHVINAFLAGGFVLALTRDRTLALITSALFAIYPTSWEAISWIAAAGHRVVLTHLLLTFTFSAIYFRTGALYSLIGLIIFFAISLATREQAILALPTIALIHWLTARTQGLSWRTGLAPYYWLIPLILAYGLFQWHFQSNNRLVATGDYGLGLQTFVNLVHLTFNVFIPHSVTKALLGPDIVSFAKAHWTIVSLSVVVGAAGFLLILSLHPATRRAVSAFVRSPTTWFALVFIAVQVSVYSLFLGSPNAASRYTYIAGLGAALFLANLIVSVHRTLSPPYDRVIVAAAVTVLITVDILNIRMGIETFRQRTNAVEDAMLAFADTLETHGGDRAYHFLNPPYVGYAWTPAVAIRFGIPESRLSAPPADASSGQIRLHYHEETGGFSRAR